MTIQDGRLPSSGAEALGLSWNVQGLRLGILEWRRTSLREWTCSATWDAWCNLCFTSATILYSPARAAKNNSKQIWIEWLSLYSRVSFRGKACVNHWSTPIQDSGSGGSDSDSDRLLVSHSTRGASATFGWFKLIDFEKENQGSRAAAWGPHKVHLSVSFLLGLISANWTGNRSNPVNLFLCFLYHFRPRCTCCAVSFV